MLNIEGKTSQVDHIVVSDYGIFVIETKNYKGWILGDEKSGQWTQVIYKKKSRFLNPIIQNKGHIKALQHHLTEPNLEATAKSAISTKLSALNIQDADARKQHVIDIHEVRARKSVSAKVSLCPRCGGELVKRNGKNGEFMGCRNYPVCKYTQ